MYGRPPAKAWVKKTNNPKKTLAEVWRCVFSEVFLVRRRSVVAMPQSNGITHNIHELCKKKWLMDGSGTPSNMGETYWMV